MKSWLRAGLGGALSAVLLWYVLRDVNVAEVVGHIRRADPLLLLLGTAVATAIFPLRAVRWRVILDPIAPRLPFGPLWRSTAIGMMVSNIVPLRAGEFARALALARETDGRVPFAAGFASIAVDRVFDAAVVLLLMFGAMLDPRFPQGATIANRPIADFAAGGMIFSGVVLVALYLLVFFPAPFQRLANVVASAASPKLAARVDELLGAFVRGLAVLRSPTRFTSVLWWTTVHWLVNALAFWIFFVAVGVDAPFSAALFLQGVISLAVALPSAPGFFGLWETAAREGLGVYRVPIGLATAWAFAFHLLSFIPITVIGAIYLSRLGLSLGEVRRGAAAGAPAEGRP